MAPVQHRQGFFLTLAIVLSVLAVFWADINAPLGIVPWVFYIVPVTVSVLALRPRAPVYTAIACSALLGAGLYVSNTSMQGLSSHAVAMNRTFGILTIWAVAMVGNRFVVSRLALAERDWIREGQRQLSVRMQGELTLPELSEAILRYLCEYLEAPVGALYVAQQDSFRRMATFATGSQAVPESVAQGEGLIGQAGKERRVLLLRDIPAGALTISGALGHTEPRTLLVQPAWVGESVHAVLELGWIRTPSAPDQELLDSVSESIAVAIRSSKYRARLRELLDQTRQQAAELQKQQDELRVANEELEQQSQVLRESQARLETQQADLELSNVRLKEQAELLVSQRDALEQAKRELTDQADALMRTSRYKSEFLANMSHELRTPLNSSLILAKLLADNKSGNLTDEQVRYAETIHGAGNELLALINDILDLSRIEAGRIELRLEDARVQEVLQSLTKTFQPVARERGLGFELRAEEGVPATIRTDPQRLQQILKNLLSNAFKFTERGTVSVRVTPSGQDRVAFVVSDTGMGIPPDRLQVIFEAFRQAEGGIHRKFGGTGLGLSIARDLARRLGGEVHVHSEPGKGSTFSLVVPVRLHESGLQPLPAPAQPLSPAHVSAPPKPAPLLSVWDGTPQVPDDRGQVEPGARSILIIEDDVRFARVLQDLAHERDFSCLVATSAAEGLHLARTRRPGAVLLDVRLPDESGLTVLEQLKREPATRHIPVHVVSVDDHAQRALELGAVGYALKPIQRDDLVDAFRKLEERLEQRLHRVLVVDDSELQRESLRQLLKSDDVQVTAVGSAAEALLELEHTRFECMILDLGLPDLSGYQLLEKMAENEAFSSPPVIVHTGRSLDPQEELRLRRYSHAVVIKGARSPERLLDEVTLFLHRVESSLPREQQRMLREARSREAVFEGRTILLAEDDVRNIFALSSALEPRGAKLRIVRNGREALEAAREAGCKGGIDLVLMDVMMPEMDGLEATRQLRKLPGCSKIPIIALTAKAMPEDRQRCLDAGANDYIAKPIDLEQLLSLIRVWMPKQVDRAE